MTKQFNSNGRILFEGKSNIDGKNIVVIITGLDNKTSKMKKRGICFKLGFITRSCPKPHTAQKWFK